MKIENPNWPFRRQLGAKSIWSQFRLWLNSTPSKFARHQAKFARHQAKFDAVTPKCSSVHLSRETRGSGARLEDKQAISSDFNLCELVLITSPLFHLRSSSSFQLVRNSSQFILFTIRISHIIHSATRSPYSSTDHMHHFIFLKNFIVRNFIVRNFIVWNFIVWISSLASIISQRH